jgi:hypothetical protein
VEFQIRRGNTLTLRKEAIYDIGNKLVRGNTSSSKVREGRCLRETPKGTPPKLELFHGRQFYVLSSSLEHK